MSAREMPPTVGGHDPREVVSALIKAIRTADDEAAVHWAVDLERSGYGAWLWKRLRIAVSEEVGLADPGLAAEIAALHATYVDLKRNKADRQKPWRLMVIHAVLAIARAPKSRLCDWTLIHAYSDHAAPREIPDVARDRHTAAGRRTGRGWDHFFDVATRLEPHAEQPGEAEARAAAYEALTQGEVLGDREDEPAQVALDLEAS